MNIRKKSVAAATAVILVITAAAVAPEESQAQQGQSIDQVYKQGVALHEAGRYTEALAMFDLVIRSNPRHIHARKFRAQTALAIKTGAGAKKADMEGALKKVILPSVALEEAPIGDVLDYITQRTEEITAGKLTPNFVYKGNQEERNSTMVTLSLRNVPVSEVIRYVGQLTRTKFIYDEHAIIADPKAFGLPDKKTQTALDEAAKPADGTFGPAPASADPFAK